MHDFYSPPEYCLMIQNITMVLSPCKGMLFDLTSSIVIYGTGEVLAGMTLQGWFFSKERLFPNLTETRTACTVEKMLQPDWKTCYGSVLTNTITAVNLHSVRWCSVPPPLLAHLCELLYLKANPRISDQPPSYHWYFGRKADFLFVLDWVGYMVQSPRWQFQNRNQHFAF